MDTESLDECEGVRAKTRQAENYRTSFAGLPRRDQSKHTHKDMKNSHLSTRVQSTTLADARWKFYPPQATRRRRFDDDARMDCSLQGGQVLSRPRFGCSTETDFERRCIDYKAARCAGAAQVKLVLGAHNIPVAKRPCVRGWFAAFLKPCDRESAAATKRGRKKPCTSGRHLFLMQDRCVGAKKLLKVGMGRFFQTLSAPLARCLADSFSLSLRGSQAHRNRAKRKALCRRAGAEF